MKIIVPNYSFDASAQTVTFTDYASIVLERVLAVINVTDQVVIYQPNSTTKGGSAATNILTLEFNTTAMDDTDDLMVIYDDPTQDFWKKEDSAHASADAGVPAWAVRKDTAAATAADGDYHPITVDALGRLWVQAMVGTAQGDLGKAEDAVAGSGDTGVMSLAVRKDTAAATAADGDYHALQVDGTGRLWVAGIGSGASDIGKAEDAAAQGGDVGVPAMAVRRDAPAANAADGDYVNLITDDLGRLRVITGKIKTVTGSAWSVGGGGGPNSGAYVAGDMIGGQITFTDIAAVNGGAFEIVSATLFSEINVLGPTDLFLFQTAVSNAADNAANAWSDADMLKCVGVISFPSPTVSANNSIATVPNLSLFGECDASDDNLYGGLVTRIGHAAYTANDDYQIRLVVRRA